MVTASYPVITDDQLEARVLEMRGSFRPANKRILLLTPDSTRPGGRAIGHIVRMIAKHWSDAKELCLMSAIGTHAIMSLEDYLKYLRISREEWESGGLKEVGLRNHNWHLPSDIASFGTFTRKQMLEFTNGKFDFNELRLGEKVPILFNKAAAEFDMIVIIGPVIPHESVGIAGGNKSLCPGISEEQTINMFHWAGIQYTCPGISGKKYTPVRRVIDHFANHIPAERYSFALVLEGEDPVGLYTGTPEAAWDPAADQTLEVNVQRIPNEVKTIVSVCPSYYEELWVAGKCTYRVSRAVRKGGSVIIYAPHLSELSDTWGKDIERAGYHCLAYIKHHLDRFLGGSESERVRPMGLVHSCTVQATGTYDPASGEEELDYDVLLASRIPQEVCRRLNLGYIDPQLIDIDSLATDDDTLVLKKGGNKLILPEGVEP